MLIKVALICLTATFLLAGCSKPGEQSGTTSTSNGADGESIDYHKLMVLGVQGAARKDPNYKAFEHAQMMCNESPTPAAAMSNPWCGAVEKAKTCALRTIFPPALSSGPELAAYAEKHPTAKCPPK